MVVTETINDSIGTGMQKLTVYLESYHWQI